MSASDATQYPTKNQALRVYFWLRDTSNAGLTAAWTGKTGACAVIIDGVVGTARDIVQIGATNCGYVDLLTSDLNSSATAIRVLPSNATAVAYEAVINPIDTDPKAVANPTTLRFTDLIAHLWQYTFGRVTNDGSNIKMYDLDGVTQIASMPITGQIEKGAGF